MRTLDTGPPEPPGSSRSGSKNERMSRKSVLCRSERRFKKYPFTIIEASSKPKEARP